MTSRHEPDAVTDPEPTSSTPAARHRMSRRGVLALGAASISALWTAGAASGTGNRPRRALARIDRPAASAPTPTASPTPTVPPQSKPVYSLAEYRAIVPGDPFPPNAVALTIDDGPHPVWTPKVLDLLERYHVPATFCLIGNQVRGHETVARSIAAAGHHVANHSYNHPTNLSGLAPEEMRDEIQRAQDKIYSATGYAPRLFRPPGGTSSPDLLAQTTRAGMTLVDWSNDPKDWLRPGTATVTQRMLAAEPGDILLCHDGGGDRSQTHAALQTVIPALLARGYTFVAL
jgi:peptidoglycan/xylan/chitin deacetylase (PgdA/CDA1 family)